jgi:ketosteroid isomerase-like protein
MSPTTQMEDPMTVTRDDVQRWLDAYVEAWRSNDADEIRALFSEDVAYRYQPYGDPVEGREAIVADWLKDPDEPGTWEAHYEPFAVDADRAVSVGTSKYFTADGSLENHYHNVFLLRFDGDGRVAEFTEYWRQVPKDES